MLQTGADKILLVRLFYINSFSFRIVNEEWSWCSTPRRQCGPEAEQSRAEQRDAHGKPEAKFIAAAGPESRFV